MKWIRAKIILGIFLLIGLDIGIRNIQSLALLRFRLASHLEEIFGDTWEMDAQRFLGASYDIVSVRHAWKLFRRSRSDELKTLSGVEASRLMFVVQQAIRSR